MCKQSILDRSKTKERVHMKHFQGSDLMGVKYSPRDSVKAEEA